MSDTEIRSLICNESNTILRKILSLDRDDSDEQVNNIFIAETVKRADGLPIYIRHLCDDLVNGRYLIENGGVDLPPSLDEYYEEILNAWR